MANLFHILKSHVFLLTCSSQSSNKSIVTLVSIAQLHDSLAWAPIVAFYSCYVQSERSLDLPAVFLFRRSPVCFALYNHLAITTSSVRCDKKKKKRRYDCSIFVNKRILICSWLVLCSAQDTLNIRLLQPTMFPLYS